MNNDIINGNNLNIYTFHEVYLVRGIYSLSLI